MYSESFSMYQISVLLTVREKLIPNQGILQKLTTLVRGGESRLDGFVMEIELKPLDELDAISLFQTCITTPNRVGSSLI